MSPILGSFAGLAARAYGETLASGFPASNFYSIATQTVGAGGAATVTFSSIPQTYSHLQIRGFVLSGVADNLDMNFNGDSTGANYVRHWLWGDGSSAQWTGNTNMGTAQFGFTSGSTTQPWNGVTEILDYTSTSKNKTIRSLGGTDLNGSGRVQFQSALWINTSAISSIVIKNDGGSNFSQNTTFALYGVK